MYFAYSHSFLGRKGHRAVSSFASDSSAQKQQFESDKQGWSSLPPQWSQHVWKTRVWSLFKRLDLSKDLFLHLFIRSPVTVAKSKVPPTWSTAKETLSKCLASRRSLPRSISGLNEIFLHWQGGHHPQLRADPCSPHLTPSDAQGHAGWTGVQTSAGQP